MFHNAIPRATFHPKIYLFESLITATLFVGSNNLTDGGFYTNYEATVRCDTALQLARWMDGAVKPSLEAAMPGETVSTLSQASAYVCRNRNSAAEGKISEHAFGNAIDIAGFTLKSGKTITIRPADKEPTLEDAVKIIAAKK